jgi:SMODS-associated and fused to various effectors sensor domain/HNH endonuclease
MENKVRTPEAKKPRARKPKNVKPDDSTPESDLCEVTRYIETPTIKILWGRAAGRCQFSGCNKDLTRSSVTQEDVNIGQQAHIYSFTRSGPRGHEGVPKEELNSVENLILVCHGCHRKFDQKADGGRYKAKLVKEMKKDHEKRIHLVTGIDSDRKSHMLFYGANVDDRSSPFDFNDAGAAMFPRRYPAESEAIDLALIGSISRDDGPEYWRRQAEELIAIFDQQVRARVSRRSIEHLSVFALAPQPLLILLGTLLGDIVPANVFQRHREPEQTWAWPESAERLELVTREPTNFDGPPAIVLGLSATVTHDRIERILPGARIWEVTVPEPSLELVKSRDHLVQFRTLIRRLLDKIKAKHGQTTTLHVFPVAAVSFAVEFGRIRMPKADMPWRVYDQINRQDGFVATLDIPYGG